MRGARDRDVAEMDKELRSDVLDSSSKSSLFGCLWLVSPSIWAYVLFYKIGFIFEEK